MRGFVVKRVPFYLKVMREYHEEIVPIEEDWNAWTQYDTGEYILYKIWL